MPEFTINLSRDHMAALKHLAAQTGLPDDDKANVQFLIVRQLENHAVDMKQKAATILLAMDDAAFSDLPRQREEMKKEQAAEEARREKEAADRQRAADEAAAALQAAREKKAAEDNVAVAQVSPADVQAEKGASQ